MIRRLTAALIAGLIAGCNWEACDGQSVDFELAAPGDAVEILVHACGPALRRDLELSLSLVSEPGPAEPLAIAVDGVDIGPTHDGWAGGDGYSVQASDADCDPGRRVTIRRIDTDATVKITGTLLAEMSAPAHRHCDATITVTPQD